MLLTDPLTSARAEQTNDTPRACVSIFSAMVVLAGGFGATAAMAQPPPDEEDIFQLPEFVVDASQDRGYRATNTLTGTFLDTPLKDSPFAIDVFMPDLIADTGSTNMREVLAYDSGLQLENTIGSQGPTGEGGYTMGTEFDARGIDNAETDIVTRGFRAPTLKNGFFTQTRVDTINIARVERAGGPQSLLYGIGAISGITNVITKRPLPEPRYRLASFVGNHDFYRGTAEATGPIWSNDNMQLNFNALLALQKEGTIRPHRKEESIFFAPALQFRGWDATSRTHGIRGTTSSTKAASGTAASTPSSATGGTAPTHVFCAPTTATTVRWATRSTPSPVATRSTATPTRAKPSMWRRPRSGSP